MAKINLESFNATSLNARLLIIHRTYMRKEEEILADEKTFGKYVADLVDENFEIDAKYRDAAISHLALFLLGKPSRFDPKSWKPAQDGTVTSSHKKVAS